MTTQTATKSTAPAALTPPETKVKTLMEQCLRQCELPSQDPALKAAAASMREYIAGYPGYQAVSTGVPLTIASNATAGKQVGA